MTPSPVISTPPIVGVMGGIASGKSLAGQLLAGERGVVLQADALAHEILREPDTIEMLRERFGPAVIDQAGEVDRAVIAARVFRDSELRAGLENWIHPRVRARIGVGLDEARKQGAECIVLDVPLLLENDAEHGLAELCDWLVFVDSPLEERERRATQSRGWESGEVARREAAQLPLHVKRDRAHHIVPNQGTRAEFEKAIAAVRRDMGLS
ncbi:MAG: dephospho-CoA kinase [Planctomycetota bacterium]|jgi:dephospho-CoA kinase